MDSINKTFDVIKTELIEFAQKRNLLLEKYWHSNPSWAFSFKHPKGGAGRLEVMLENNGLMKVYGYWWMDDYYKGIRYSKGHQSEFIPVIEVPALLEQFFKLILDWNLDNWTEITKGYKQVWHPIYTKKQFTQLYEKYPLPNL